MKPAIEILLILITIVIFLFVLLISPYDYEWMDGGGTVDGDKVLVGVLGLVFSLILEPVLKLKNGDKKSTHFG